MKVAAIIPTYNRASMIAETLESILNQTRLPDEIFVCDDGSTDDTIDVLKRYKGKVAWKTITNSGPAVARREAIEETNATWFAPCDSDDIWLPDHLERKIAIVEKWPDVDFVFSNFTYFGGEKTGEFDKFQTAPADFWPSTGYPDSLGFGYLGTDSFSRLLTFQPIFPSGMFFSRALYNRIGGIRSRVARMASEDAHMTRRLAAYGNLACDWNRTVEIRRHPGNFSSDFLRNCEGRLAILEMLIEDNEIPKKYVDATVREIKRSKERLFDLYRWNGDYRKAVILAKETDGIRKSPKSLIKYLYCLFRSYS